MKKSPLLIIAGLAFGASIASANLITYDGFAYPVGDLTGATGGSGWTLAWEGANPVVVRTPGLGYTDIIGNVLTTAGSALNTSDGSGVTTISSREVTDRNAETWISMLLQPQNTSTTFVGVSFYQNDLVQTSARFAVENSGKDLRLVRRGGGTVTTGAFSTTIGTTAMAVIHLVPGGGSGATPDLIEVYFNPRLDVQPTSPNATVQINGLQFDRVRIAGSNANSILVDELRIGETYADVLPFTPPADPDVDADGLTNAQEVALGLNPNVPDTAFIAAVKANPGLFNLYSKAQIVERKVRGPVLNVFSPEDMEYSYDMTKGSGTVMESITKPLPAPPLRSFLRLYLDETP